MQQPYANALYHYNRLTEPLYRQALATVQLETGSLGLDAGCGVGGVFPLLRECCGGEARIVGVDASMAHLRAATATVVPLIAADLSEPLPFKDGAFDWVWCADTLWPHTLPDTEFSLREGVRVLKPGGCMMLFFEQPFRGVVLPGYAHLESLIRRALHMMISPEADPHYNVDQTALWLQRAGLRDVRFSMHSHLYSAPLSESARHYLENSVFGWYRTIPEHCLRAAGMTDAEWETWRRISQPDSRDYILDRPEYYYLRLASFAVGVKA